MRYRECFERHPAGRLVGLELEDQARLADSWLGHRGDNLSVPACLFGGALNASISA